ncbi:MAG: FAD-binding oxidoreductase [Oligoflexia bacterium]|nr:FAD-binding oxidoreductase [Oligoflexia bacterium]
MQAEKNILSRIQKEFSVMASQDPKDLDFYGKDWTLDCPPNPLAILFPKSTEEVSKILKFCSQENIPIVPSGGRTGLSGGAMATQGELVLSLEKMNKIGKVCTLSRTLIVESGAITEAVHQETAKYNLTWPVDFASKGSSQVGGNISTNAGGVNVIRYGNTRNWVLGLEVVLMNGEVLSINGALEKNNSGIDLRQLFIGSEGILGVITKATLKLVPLEKNKRVFLFGANNLKQAFKICRFTRENNFQLNALELFSGNCREAVSEKMNVQNPFSTAYSWYVLVEIDEKNESAVDQWLVDIFEKSLAEDGLEAKSSEEIIRIWKLREGIAESIGMIGHYHKNDVAVPVDALEDFLEEYNSLVTNEFARLQPYTFGHIGDGNLHINTLKKPDVSEQDFLEDSKELDIKLYILTTKYLGTVSGEHGVGLLKKKHLHYTRSKTEIQIMKEIKKILDPKNLLNPGKVID